MEMFSSIKPYSVSSDGIPYYWEETSNLYAKRLGLKGVIVLVGIDKNKLKKYVINIGNKEIYSSAFLDDIGAHLEQLADQRR